MKLCWIIGWTLLSFACVHGETICDVLTSGTPEDLQGVIPFGDTFFLIIRNVAFSVPFTAKTIDPKGHLTFGGTTKQIGHWSALPFFSNAKPTLPTGATLSHIDVNHFEKADTYAQVIYKSGGTLKRCVISKNSSFTCGVNLEAQNHYSCLSSGFKKASYQLLDKSDAANTKLEHANFVAQYEINNVNFLVTYYVLLTTTTIQFNKHQPANLAESTRYRIGLPAFGFIHDGQIHLWLPRKRLMVLFANDPNIAKLLGDTTLLNITLEYIPFRKYFNCHADAPPYPKDISGNTTAPSDAVDQATSLYIIAGILFVLMSVIIITSLIICNINRRKKLSKSITRYVTEKPKRSHYKKRKLGCMWVRTKKLNSECSPDSTEKMISPSQKSHHKVNSRNTITSNVKGFRMLSNSQMKAKSRTLKSKISAARPRPSSRLEDMTPSTMETSAFTALMK